MNKVKDEMYDEYRETRKIIRPWGTCSFVGAKFHVEGMGRTRKFETLTEAIDFMSSFSV